MEDLQERYKSLYKKESLEAIDVEFIPYDELAVELLDARFHQFLANSTEYEAKHPPVKIYDINLPDGLAEISEQYRKVYRCLLTLIKKYSIDAVDLFLDIDEKPTASIVNIIAAKPYHTTINIANIIYTALKCKTLVVNTVSEFNEFNISISGRLYINVKSFVPYAEQFRSIHIMLPYKAKSYNKSSTHKSSTQGEIYSEEIYSEEIYNKIPPELEIITAYIKKVMYETDEDLTSLVTHAIERYKIVSVEKVTGGQTTTKEESDTQAGEFKEDCSVYTGDCLIHGGRQRRSRSAHSKSKDLLFQIKVSLIDMVSKSEHMALVGRWAIIAMKERNITSARMQILSSEGFDHLYTEVDAFIKRIYPKYSIVPDKERRFKVPGETQSRTRSIKIIMDGESHQLIEYINFCTFRMIPCARTSSGCLIACREVTNSIIFYDMWVLYNIYLNNSISQSRFQETIIASIGLLNGEYPEPIGLLGYYIDVVELYKTETFGQDTKFHPPYIPYLYIKEKGKLRDV